MNSPQNRTSGSPVPGGALESAPSERLALVVIVTGVLAVPAPTAIQVLWLVLVAAGAAFARFGGRGSAPEPPSSP